MGGVRAFFKSKVVSWKEKQKLRTRLQNNRKIRAEQELGRARLTGVELTPRQQRIKRIYDSGKILVESGAMSAEFLNKKAIRYAENQRFGSAKILKKAHSRKVRALKKSAK